MSMGRPSDYTEELADTICAELAAGKPLTSICVGEEFPSPRTVYRWLREHEPFRHNYARAREDQADTLADEILTVADDQTIPAEHKRIMVDSRKWNASKLKPGKYGDRVDHTVASPAGGPVEHSITVKFV